MNVYRECSSIFVVSDKKELLEQLRIEDRDKEEAVIEMVDSNLQREHILPSEKAKA